MRISLADLSFRFSHQLPPGKEIASVAVDERGNLECTLRDKPDTRHVYRPNKKYPWFCECCGYAEHETLMHRPKGE